MHINDFSARIMKLIADGDTEAALKAMQSLLQKSPLFAEAVVQSARYDDTMRAIRMGTLTDSEANAEKNKIRYALLDMLRELEEGVGTRADMAAQVEASLAQSQGTHISHSKNVVTGQISAGGNVQIGDVTHHTGQQADKIYNINKIDKADFS